MAHVQQSETNGRHCSLKSGPFIDWMGNPTGTRLVPDWCPTGTRLGPRWFMVLQTQFLALDLLLAFVVVAILQMWANPLPLPPSNPPLTPL